MPESKAGKQWRILNRDGKFNVSTRGTLRRLDFTDLYYQLMTASWPKFFLILCGCYFSINLIFAAAYFFCGPAALTGVHRSPFSAHFLDCFFFSVQTLATIGYGRISPVSAGANFLVALEALAGMLSIGLMSGLLFTRFSRSTARVAFSRTALIHRENGIQVFSFRMANERLNQISEARLHVTLVKSEVSEEGEEYRKLYDVKLERSHSPLFLLSWTATHIINEDSPFFGVTEEDLRAGEAEIMVSLTGIDNAFAQPIQARISYTADDILWGGRFADMIDLQEDGNMYVDLKKIHDVIS